MAGRVEARETIVEEHRKQSPDMKSLAVQWSEPPGEAWVWMAADIWKRAVSGGGTGALWTHCDLKPRVERSPN